MDNIKIEALKSFFNLFEANVSLNKDNSINIFIGTLSWVDEEDTQEFKWYNIFNDETLTALKRICDFIKEHKLNDNDKITISEEDLRNELKQFGWNNTDIEIGINSLMSINICMLDEGEETDSFFLHF